ncbi:hypothetical protein PLESTB_001825000 [Pleodorina starrii]|uniref:Response regulatory domain-containing protein n=1 Tax=Pleodorina starrii TaxID=330485 RepID=A0A9W6FAM6_9CHLO|nr:hypothetical protein PLESTB_001825000 [Pleodorina starrii]
MLQSRGYAVTEVTSGSRAIECIRDNAPAIVLMDINMPGMTGVEAALEITDLMGSDAPAIVAVTGDDTSQRRAECEAAGFDGFIPKPVRVIEKACRAINVNGSLASARDGMRRAGVELV